MLKSYRYSGKSFIKLNSLQKSILKNINNINGKDLVYEKNDCVCGKEESINISERCKFGLNVNFKLCKICGLVRQDPVLSEKSLQFFYNNFYRSLYTGKNDQENIKKIFEEQYKSGIKYYEVIKKNLLRKNNNIEDYREVLEIGASSGGILAYFLKKGHDVYAIDYDEKYLNFAHKSGIKNIYTKIHDIGKKFDLIILSHTFEHFKDIKNYLSIINNLLKEKGIIFFDLPGIFNKDYYHIRNIIYEVKRLHFLFYLQNAHTFYFTKEKFEIFLNNQGMFDIIFIDEKINCLIQKNEKKTKNENYPFNYKKVLNFIKYNDIRYKALIILQIILYPVLYFIKKIKIR